MTNKTNSLFPDREIALALNSSESIGDELIDLMGRHSAQALLNTFGGRDLFIPKTVNEDHAIAKVIGLGPARALSSAFPGIEVRLPMRLNPVHKKAEIEHLLATTNLSYRDIAQRVGTHQGWVERVASQWKKKGAERQTDLFATPDEETD